MLLLRGILRATVPRESHATLHSRAILMTS
jgi:hypothetical protein